MISADHGPCADPACIGLAEPETDGEHTYLVCTQCGYHFNYRRPDKVLAKPDNACAVGVPESVRRAASRPMTEALNANQLPLLQIGKPHARDHPEGRLDGPGSPA